MLQSAVFNDHVAEYEAWYEAYSGVYQSEVLALKEHLETLPENLRGIEVGLGTGRFSSALGIKEGIEPAIEMARIAEKRGTETMQAYAENLPYGSMQFDFVLFVTICFLHNLKAAVQEAHRVLKPRGALIIGFLEKGKPIANFYEHKRPLSTFYKHAHFYTVYQLEKILMNQGFRQLAYNQTLFGELDDIREVQAPEPGNDKGSFVVVKAVKK